jgi:hypothetical protein
MRRISLYVAALAVMAAFAKPAAAQQRVEMGIDAAAIFGLGDQSSTSITFPASRFRLGFFQPGSRLSIEPALGLAYTKTEGVDGLLFYDLELGALYHLSPITVASRGTNVVDAVSTAPYLRPFIGVSGVTGGDSGDSEFSAGVGLGTRVAWRPDLAFRLEANLGYGFDNDAARIGLLAGLSFFPR